MSIRKICTQCKIERDISEFYKGKSECKKCNNLRSQNYKKEHKQEISLYNRKYKEEHQEETREYRDKYYAENKEKENENSQKYYQDNKERINTKRVEYVTERRANDLTFRLRQDISSAIRSYLQKNDFSKDGNSILQFLPYSIQDLISHLESQFEPWMNWENRGVYKTDEWIDDDQSTWKWNIDHIIPQSVFKFSSMEEKEFKQCWALDNLRPLSAKQNILEGNRRKTNV